MKKRFVREESQTNLFFCLYADISAQEAIDPVCSFIL